VLPKCRVSDTHAVSDTSQDTDDDSSDSDNSECTEQPEDNNDLNPQVQLLIKRRKIKIACP
jgi:hypothetical protein